MLAGLHSLKLTPMALLTAAWRVLLELAPWLLLGAGVAGLLHVILPPGFVRRNLGGRGGVLKAVLLGVPLPLCSCGVIPAGLGLKRDGASDGAAIGFLIATPQTGVDSVLVSGSFLGWPFAAFKVASAFVLGLVGGALADWGSSKHTVSPPPAAEASRPTWREGIAHALEIVETIWKWIAFGILASAAIETFVPREAFAVLGEGSGFAAMLAALVVSLPLYVCATASVPIAAALVAGGFPPGAALVFLMAGPATNVATVGAVTKAFGRRGLSIYLATIGAGSLLFGWLFDFLLADVAYGPGAAHNHGAGWGSVAAAVVLLGLLVFFAVRELAVRFRPAAADDAGPVLELGVDGLTCDGCVRKLEGKLVGADGVESVAVDRLRGVATVRGVIDEARVREIVRQAGFVPR